MPISYFRSDLSDYAVAVITAPAAEPLTLCEVKEHLRVSFAEDDAKILGLIAAATEYAERVTNRAFVTQTLELQLRRFPFAASETAQRKLYLPRAPLQSVTSVTYTDNAGDAQTWAAANYKVDTSQVGGYLEPVYGKTYPTARWEAASVAVRYVAGYGNPTDVPEGIKAALRAWIHAAYYPCDCGPAYTAAVANLLAPYIVGDQWQSYANR